MAVATATIADVEADLLHTARELEREANKVYDELVLPNWEGFTPGFAEFKAAMQHMLREAREMQGEVDAMTPDEWRALEAATPP